MAPLKYLCLLGILVSVSSGAVRVTNISSYKNVKTSSIPLALRTNSTSKSKVNAAPRISYPMTLQDYGGPAQSSYATPSQSYTTPSQSYGSNQGYSGSSQGNTGPSQSYGSSKQYTTPSQSYGSNQGYSGSNQGYTRSNLGYTLKSPQTPAYTPAPSPINNYSFQQQQSYNPTPSQIQTYAVPNQNFNSRPVTYAPPDITFHPPKIIVTKSGVIFSQAQISTPQSPDVQPQTAPSYIPNQQAPSYVQSQPSPSYVQTQQAPSYIQTQPVLSFIQPQQAPSYVQTQQAPSYIQNQQPLQYSNSYPAPYQSQQYIPTKEGSYSNISPISVLPPPTMYFQFNESKSELKKHTKKYDPDASYEESSSFENSGDPDC